MICCGMKTLWIENVPGKGYNFCQECRKEVTEVVLPTLEPAEKAAGYPRGVSNVDFWFPTAQTQKYTPVYVDNPFLKLITKGTIEVVLPELENKSSGIKMIVDGHKPPLLPQLERENTEAFVKILNHGTQSFDGAFYSSDKPRLSALVDLVEYVTGKTIDYIDITSRVNTFHGTFKHKESK